MKNYADIKVRTGLIIVLCLLSFLFISFSSQGTKMEASRLVPAESVPLGTAEYVLLDELTNNAQILKQVHFRKNNATYVIRRVFTLGENITIPNNCVLKFEGGSLRGAFTIKGQDTRIEAGMSQIFGAEITLTGNWSEYSWNICWFGASTGAKDNAPFIKRALGVVYSLGTDISKGYGFNDCGIFIPSGKFNVASQIVVDSRFNVYGNGSSSVIYSKYSGNLFLIKGIRGTISLNNINFICDDSVSTTCNCITLNTDQGTAIGRITNCDFANFNIALDLVKPYWLRITSCNFIYSNEYAIKAQNANSFSLLSCNFRAADGKNSPANQLYFTGDVQGVCISGCDFSGAYKSSIRLENVNGYGVQITGNYFEPGCGSVCSGGLIETSNCRITDLMIKANAAYESGAFDSSVRNMPRYYILLRNSSIYRSDIVGNVIIDGTLKGNSNSLVGRICTYSDIKDGRQNLIDKYYSLINQAMKASNAKAFNSSLKNVEVCFSEIQKKMMDVDINKNNVEKYASVFYNLQNVEASTGEARSGSYARRPSSKDIHNGYQYFNTDTHKMITWFDGKWWNPDGTEANK